jgi:hypothetical protein
MRSQTHASLHLLGRGSLQRVMTMHEVEDAYRRGRHRARSASTVRLRWIERRGRRRSTPLSQPELAHLKAVRDELRCRGVDISRTVSRS